MYHPLSHSRKGDNTSIIIQTCSIHPRAKTLSQFKPSNLLIFLAQFRVFSSLRPLLNPRQGAKSRSNPISQYSLSNTGESPLNRTCTRTKALSRGSSARSPSITRYELICGVQQSMVALSYGVVCHDFWPPVFVLIVPIEPSTAASTAAPSSPSPIS